MGKRVVVVGSSFAGLTAALLLRKRLEPEHPVILISKTDRFLFTPSLIWVPFGLRSADEVTFPVRPVLEQKHVAFVHEPVRRLDLAKQVVTAGSEEVPYDYLVLATGASLDYGAVRGLGPVEGFTDSIYSLGDAELARDSFERFVRDPGPVVVGAVQGASGFTAAYEFVLNLAHQLERRGVKDRAPLTFITPEPHLGHFGMGGFGNAAAAIGEYFAKLGVRAVVNASVREITREELHLEDGSKLPFKFAMLAPPYVGIGPVKECTEIVDAQGFVRVNPYYHTRMYAEVYAAGMCVSLDPPAPTQVPCGVPKSGYLSEEMAKLVAYNIAADIDGEKRVALDPQSIDAKAILDAGDGGLILAADRFLSPREHAWVIPGPEAHWAKLAYERWFIATRSIGLIR